MTRTPAQAIQVMKDRDARNETGWQALCLKSCRTAYDLPGGWSEADVWWDSCPDEYKHPWSDKPPFGMPIYWRIGEYGHVALSNGDGTIYGTDLPTNDQIGKCSIDLPRTRWGAKPVGWANWLNGEVLPYEGNPGTSNPGEPSQGDEGMDYAECKTADAGVSVTTNWSYLSVPLEVRDSAGIHYKDSTWSLAGRRFQFTIGTSIKTDDAIITMQAVMLDGETVISTTPQMSAGAPEQSPGFVLAGYCPKDQRVRIRVKATKNTTLNAYVTAFSWV